MPNIQNDFNQKIELIKTLSYMSDENKLDLYKYYKQATIGDINIEEPGFFNFVGKVKWKAWHKLKGISKEDAMNEYIIKANELMDK
jgi:diazepam-binding inhibitor (GABA receptor modulating acyl-CoA-binding protein)